jgi:hypothetical protein
MDKRLSSGSLFSIDLLTTVAILETFRQYEYGKETTIPF